MDGGYECIYLSTSFVTSQMYIPYCRIRFIFFDAVPLCEARWCLRKMEVSFRCTMKSHCLHKDASSSCQQRNGG